MAHADPIADMLTRIRNGIRSKKQTVVIPGSNLKREILDRLNEAGYLPKSRGKTTASQGILTVELKYDDNEDSVIDGLRPHQQAGPPGLRRSRRYPRRA